MVGEFIEDFRLSFGFKIRPNHSFPDFDLPFKHVRPPRFALLPQRSLATASASPAELAVPQGLAGSSGAVFDLLFRPSVLGSGLVFPADRARGTRKRRGNGVSPWSA